jgi:hypothetical protein
MTILQEELDNIELHVGDIIIQRNTGFIGLLMERFCNYPPGYISIHTMGDMWFWRIGWLKNVDRNKNDMMTTFLNPILEEEGLKMSIFIGNIEHYSNTPFIGMDDEL